MSGGDLDVRGVDVFAERGIIATKTGVEFSLEVTFDDCALVARVASGALDMSKWWLADAINIGERMWGDRYVDLHEWTGRSVEGLMNIASVGRRVPHAIRREGLTFSHHEVVAALERAEQVQFLDRAEEDGLTVAELRSLLKATRPHDVVRFDPDSESAEEPSPEPGQLVIDERQSLRQVATEIAEAERDERGMVCLGRNVLSRLRHALDQETE